MQSPEEYLKSIDSNALAELRAQGMPVTIMVSENECVDNAYTFKTLGYEPAIIPTIPYREGSDTTLLQDTEEGEDYIPAELDHGEANGHRAKVRSLRMSWMFALDMNPISTPFNGTVCDGRIICERRAIPMMKADELRIIIKAVLAEHPDTDVIRLFNIHTSSIHSTEDKAELGNVDRDNLSVELPAGTTQTRLSPECDGTYAMYVANASKEKVKSVFRRLRMPVDTALEYAASTGELKVRKLTFNAFVRDTEVKEYVKKKYCVQLSNYARPMQLLSQVTSIKEQLRYADSDRLHINIVLRGYDKATFHVLSSQVAVELKGYSHTVTALPNRTQLLNFVEVPEGFDQYIKMDDDDYYDVLFLRSTMEFLDRTPSFMCSLMSGGAAAVAVCMKSEEQDRPILRYDITGACENTASFPKSMLDRMIDLHRDIKIFVTVGKATDAVPMRSLINSNLCLNRFEYWRTLSILLGRKSQIFSVLNYEGSDHATGKSNYGAFANNAGFGAAEYCVRMFDLMEYVAGHDAMQTVRANFGKFKGIDAAIVTSAPGAEFGMYIPMSNSWGIVELGAAQPISDIKYDEVGHFVYEFKMVRSGTVYRYELTRGLMLQKVMLDDWKQTAPEEDVYDWLASKISRLE